MPRHVVLIAAAGQSWPPFSAASSVSIVRPGTVAFAASKHGRNRAVLAPCRGNTLTTQRREAVSIGRKIGALPARSPTIRCLGRSARLSLCRKGAPAGQRRVGIGQRNCQSLGAFGLRPVYRDERTEVIFIMSLPRL